MTVDALLLAVTTLIALVAVVIAVVAVRAVRELKRSLESARDERTSLHFPTVSADAAFTASDDETTAVTSDPDPRPVELAPRVVEGRVVVPPTQSQVVRTALGRPGVRFSVFAHGLARALRPENRDRIVALMRREYRHRRRERLRAGRQAVRMARPTSAPTTDRLHEHLLEPRPLTLTDRMIGS
jgi:hypothetical protein